MSSRTCDLLQDHPDSRVPDLGQGLQAGSQLSQGRAAPPCQERDLEPLLPVRILHWRWQPGGTCRAPPPQPPLTQSGVPLPRPGHASGWDGIGNGMMGMELEVKDPLGSSLAGDGSCRDSPGDTGATSGPGPWTGGSWAGGLCSARERGEPSTARGVGSRAPGPGQCRGGTVLTGR